MNKQDRQEKECTFYDDTVCYIAGANSFNFDYILNEHPNPCPLYARNAKGQEALVTMSVCTVFDTFIEMVRRIDDEILYGRRFWGASPPYSGNPSGVESIINAESTTVICERLKTDE